MLLNFYQKNVSRTEKIYSRSITNIYDRIGGGWALILQTTNLDFVPSVNNRGMHNPELNSKI